jgi:hypothetical protein
MKTKREIMRQHHQLQTLQALGFTQPEAEALRRISMTLQRWYEWECGTEAGHLERDEATGIPYRVQQYGTREFRTPTPDRETGAIKRLEQIIHARNTREAWLVHPTLSYYLQTDPRGAALYILRPQDVPAGESPAAYYSRGICIY